MAFDKALSGYTTQKIQSAFEEYLKIGTAMPLPADIIKIIERKHVASGEGTKMPAFPDNPVKELTEAERQRIDSGFSYLKQKLRGY